MWIPFVGRVNQMLVPFAVKLGQLQPPRSVQCRLRLLRREGKWERMVETDKKGEILKKSWLTSI